jgi:hypothetical protein
VGSAVRWNVCGLRLTPEAVIRATFLAVSTFIAETCMVNVTQGT